MILLTSGVLLWSGAHLFKRIAPDARARLGNAGRPLMAVLLLTSVVLMTLGYQQASTTVWWGRQTAWVGVNNLLVYLGFYLIAGSQVGARVVGVIRHPQLTAVKLWAVAHLLVNGDSASLLLFGGLLVWAALRKHAVHGGLQMTNRTLTLNGSLFQAASICAPVSNTS
jgi:uncharacterized membrane protein